MKSLSNLEIIYQRSGPNERDIDHSFEFCDQIRVRQPTEAQKDSDGESGISISSHQSKISISSHKTKTNNAPPQQKREGIVLFKASTKVSTISGEWVECLFVHSNKSN